VKTRHHDAWISLPIADLVIGDLALTNIAVGNKAATVALSKQAVNLVLLD